MFYLARAPDSWVPAYARSRGLDDAVARDWRIVYAPAGWTTLTDHLRGLGHGDQSIEAAGLARRSSRGTLIDHFRDRAMLAIRDAHGTIAGASERAGHRFLGSLFAVAAMTRDGAGTGVMADGARACAGK